MKANELRIGNYYYGDVLFPSEYNVITANDLVELDSDPLDDYYQPLPLTEEWLLKFGFKKIKTNNCVYWTLNNVDVWELNGIYANENDLPIQFVNQLQNLYFALTKKELTIM
jgi:hypothetical protein